MLQNKKDVLVHRIKTIILHTVYYSEEPLAENLSVYLSRKLDYDYTYLSNLFSNKQGITIEKFYIYSKIERVKEQLTYSGLSLTDIAYRMHYSSVAHLSNQFKRVIGMTPSEFKRAKVGGGDLLEQSNKQYRQARR